MVEDLTPPQYRCAMAMACPSITRLEDGRLEIRGDLKLVHEDDNSIGRPEATIVIDPGLLETVFTQWLEARNG